MALYTVTKYPQSNDSGFTNASNAYADDGLYASASPAKNSTITGKWYNFDFGIPDGSGIDSIEIEVEWFLSTTVSIHTFGIQAYMGNTPMGTEYTTTSEPTTPTVTTKSTGNGNWKLSWINDNSSDGFSIRLRSTRGNSDTAVTCYVDYIKVTITYAPPTQTQTNSTGDVFSESAVAELPHAGDNLSDDFLYEIALANLVGGGIGDGSYFWLEVEASLVGPSKEEYIDSSINFSDITALGFLYRDYIAFYENIAIKLSKIIIEELGLSDFNSLEGSKDVIKDFIYFYEVVAKSIFLYPLSSIGLVDSIRKSIGKRIDSAIDFLINILVSFVRRYDIDYDKIYFNDYISKSVGKVVSDSLVIAEVFELIKPPIVIVTESLANIVDSVSKLFSKPVSEEVEVDDLFEYLHRRGSWLYLQIMKEKMRLTDSVSKVVKVVKSDQISLLIFVVGDRSLIIQDSLELIDLYIGRIGRPRIDVIDIDDIIKYIHTIPIYFDAGQVYPEYVIGDLRIYGGAEMHFYPNQTVVVKWKVREFENDTLIDPDSHSIEVYDSKGVKRVGYDVNNLYREGIGSYRYHFNIPSDVVVGDWYVKVSAVSGAQTTVLAIHFDVRKV